MRITFRDIPDDAEGRQLIEGAASVLSVPDDAVEEIIVAKDYLAAVKSIDASASVTNTDGNESVGKTLTREVAGAIRCSVVCPADSIARIKRAKLANPDPTTWSRDDQLSYFGVLHEFGHCIDYHTRQVMQVRRRTSFPSEDEVAEFYWPALLEEFAATCHAASVVGRRMGQYVAGNCERRIADARQQWNDCIQTAWYILVEDAKNCGLWIANSELEQFPSFDWLRESRAVKDTIGDFEDVLRELWRSYPHWQPSPSREFKESVREAAYVLVGMPN